jgi:hypothetical protein
MFDEKKHFRFQNLKSAMLLTNPEAKVTKYKSL